MTCNSDSSSGYLKRKKLCSQLFEICLQRNDVFKLVNFMQMWTLLEELVELEKGIDLCCQNDRTEDSFKDLYNSIDSECINSDNICIEKQSQNDFTLKTNKNFEKDDLLFQIRAENILTLNSLGNESPLKKAISNDKMLSAMPNVSLALLLLSLRVNINQKNVPKKQNQDFKLAMKWKAYLNVLPSEFNTPIFFSLNEIFQLKGAQCFGDIINHIKFIVRQYAYIFNLLDSNQQKEIDILKSNFTYKNYCWAVSCITTRQNKVQDTLALIPFIEMCNHNDINTAFITLDTISGTASCHAQTKLENDEKLTIFYGPRNNRDLLIHNGFICEENVHDVLCLKLGISSKDPLIEKRSLILEKYGLKTNETFEIKKAYFNTESINLLKLFFFVKVFTSKSNLDDLLMWHEIKASGIDSDDVLFTELHKDKEVKDFLTMRLQLLLRGYTTTSAANSHDLSQNEMFINRLILSEMNLIKCFIEFLAND